MKIISFLCLILVVFTYASAQIQGTQVVSDKGVFFFGPSIAEADSVGSEESEALSDFAYYNNKFASFVRTKGIKCEYISSRKIIVQYATVKQFIVSRDSIEFGTILSDGKKTPLLFKFVLTDEDLDHKCKKFFNYK